MIVKTCYIEEAIGETRAAILYRNEPIEYFVRRWSDANKPLAGDIFHGRVTKIDKSMMAAFVDLGSQKHNGPHGLFNFTQNPKAPRLIEGQMIRVTILREAEPSKGPLLGFLDMSDKDKPTKEKSRTLKDLIRARYKDIKFVDHEVDDLEWAGETEVPLRGGGYLYIEHTRAGTMIDIDTAGAGKTEVAIKAARKIANQVRLRGIGGLILIDFPNLRKHKDRETVFKALTDAFKDDPDNVKIAPMSRFGTVQFTRARRGAILTHILNDDQGNPTPETIALQGLRRLQKEARIDGGAKLVLNLPKGAYDWLHSGVIDWQKPLDDTFGARLSVQQGDKTDVHKE